MDDLTKDVSKVENDGSDTGQDLKGVAGLAEQVVDFNTVAPGTDFEDMAALREVFADRRVVGLGEATHGAREFFRLKHRLVQFLVKEFGVRLVGLEANFPETLAVNRYVCRGDGDPEAALRNIYVWTWQTEEVLALIKWLRAFNSDRPPDNQVRFYGFDMQKTRGAADAVVDYLDRVDPDYLAAVREDLAVLADPGLRLSETDGRDKRLAAADRIVPNLRTIIEDRRTNYVARSSERSWELARQHATILEQATEFGMAVHTGNQQINEESIQIRDRAMAENISWILDQESAECITVWTHNDHVNRVKTTIGGNSAPSMGSYLAQWYGDAYYALGLEFGQGAFQAFVETEDEDWTYEVRECSLAGPLPDTVASALTTLNQQLVFLDFRTAKADPRLADWLTGEHRLHWVGATYDPEQPEDYVQPYVLAEAFDGICYVDKTTESSLLGRD